MTPEALFGLVFGPVAFASVLALIADILRQRTAARVGSALLLAAGAIVSFAAGSPAPPGQVFGSFVVGAGYSTVAGVVFALAALALLASSNREGSVPSLVALSAGGAAMASASTDLITLLVSLEIAAVSGYALIAGARSRRAEEAAMKYYVQGAVATGLLVLGIAVLVAGGGGSAVPYTIAATFGQLGAASPLILGSMAVVTALSFKAGVAPFHSWSPDAYENAPAPSASFLAGGVKLGTLVALAGIVAALSPAGMGPDHPLGLLGSEMVTVLGMLSIASVAVGSTVALRTGSYTRMLGYAGVAQVGYAFVAMSALQPAIMALFAATYAVATTGAFIAAEVFRGSRPDWDGSIAGLRGIAREEPLTAVALTVLLMSLAGIPPLVGFWGKLQAFGAALNRASQMFGVQMVDLGLWLSAVAVVGVVGSIISLGYYGSVVRAMYFDGRDSAGEGEARAGDGKQYVESRRAARSVVVFLALAALVLGVVPFVFGISDSIRLFVL